MVSSDLKNFYNNLAPITDEEWEKLSPLMRIKSFKKNDFLIQAQEIPEHFGIILNGLFRLYYIDDDGKEWVKSFRSTFDLVGAYAELLQKLPSRTFIQALADSTVLMINAKEFSDFTHNKLSWQILLRRITEIHFITKENREFEFLKLSALERYENFKKEYAQYADSIPNYHIASYLGITPQALSRLQNKSTK